MPQFADPNVLMQARGIQTPGPMDLAQSGLTLADLYAKSMSANLGLQAQQANISLLTEHPEILQALFGGSVGTGPPADGPAPNSNPLANLSPDEMKRYAPGIPGMMTSILGIKKTQAETSEANAKAAEANRKVLDAQLGKIGNVAANAAMAPSAEKMLQVAFMLKNVGTDPNSFGAMPNPYVASPQAISSWLAGVGSLSTDPAAQEQIRTLRAKTPAEVGHITAQTGQVQEQTREMPARLAIDRFNAFTGANKPTGTVDAQGNMVYTAPYGLGLPSMGGGSPGAPAPAPAAPAAPAAPVAGAPPAAAPAMPPPAPLVPTGRPSGATATDAAGNPIKVAQSVTEKEITGINAKEVGEANAQKMQAHQVQAQILDMRNQEGQGMYSGGIQGTEYFRKLANVMQSLGILSNENAAKLASSQVWSADAKNLVALSVKQWAGSRVAKAELGYFSEAKPNELMTPAGREKTYRALYNASQRIIDIGEQGQEYFDANKGSLKGFTPKFTPIELPPIEMTTPLGSVVQARDATQAAAILRQWQTMQPTQ